jgi:hypothetical protein
MRLVAQDKVRPTGTGHPAPGEQRLTRDRPATLFPARDSEIKVKLEKPFINPARNRRCNRNGCSGIFAFLCRVGCDAG